MRCVSIWAAVAAVVWWGLESPAGAQEQKQGQQQEQQTPEASEKAAENGEKPGAEVEIVVDPDLEEEFTTVELALQLSLAQAKGEGEKADLESVQALGLSVAETDRQKAYVYLRIAEMYYQRGDKDAAILALKEGLPLADGDRSKGSLYYRILVGLLTVYNETGRIREAQPYLKIYREIVAAGVDPWERFAESNDVIHKPTGIRLPHKLNMFTRERLIVFDDTGRDAGGSYKVEGGRFPEMTVYVVAEFNETAENHFNTAMGHILNRFEGAEVLSRGPYSAESDRGTIKGFAGRVNIPAKGFSLGLGSDLYVFVREGTLIKFRVTFRASNREKIEGVMREIFKSFDWPQGA